MGFFRQRSKKIQGIQLYKDDFEELKRQQASSDIDFPFGDAYPCYADRDASGGEASGHYFHQDLLVARRIHKNKPDKHVDIGSRVDGFVAHVAAYRQIEVFDIRAIESKIPNIRFAQADLMSTIPEQLHHYCDSLSCLHAIEHFGLGRYGDPVNFTGYLDGLHNLELILKPKGTLYLSVPIGPQRIEFNAHRVFSIQYLLSLLGEKFDIKHFSYVDDRGDLYENAVLTEDAIKSNFSCNYGCGIFELIKK